VHPTDQVLSREVDGFGTRLVTVLRAGKLGRLRNP
jgi:hypothetical protein